MHIFYIFEFLGCDHRWTLRKIFTRYLMVCKVPTHGQNYMWTPVVTSQSNASKMFTLRNGHRWTLVCISSLDSTHYYITVHNFSARIPVRNDRMKHTNSPSTGWPKLLPATYSSNQECRTGENAVRNVSMRLRSKLPIQKVYISLGTKRGLPKT